MNELEAVTVAKRYVENILADEEISNLGLEEIEPDLETNGWLVTVAFSRPWNSPRTKAREALEAIGAYSNLRRSYKVILVSPDGQVLSMKSRSRAEVE